MSNGGGNWLSENKIIPGFYANFLSKKYATSALSERGIVTIPVILPWCKDGEMFTVTQEQFQTNTFNIFGMEYDDTRLQGLRELFLHARIAYIYNLNTTGTKATIHNGSQLIATAKYKGTVGNSLAMTISSNVATPAKFDVVITLSSKTVFSQEAIETTADLDENDWVDWESDITPTTTACTTTAGTDAASVTTTVYQAYMSAAESYSFNIMALPVAGISANTTLQTLFANNVTRMRGSYGKLFQLVLHNYEDADYEGVISVKSNLVGETSGAESGKLVYWVAGAEAGCAVNKSLVNTKYDGELDINITYSQSELEDFITDGYFIFHNVDGNAYVLDDINSFTTFTDAKNNEFASNQTIRTIDTLWNAEAVAFSQSYMGKVQNNKDGRALLWNRFTSIKSELVAAGALESFNASDLTIEQGSESGSVLVTDSITVANAMKKLYMTVYLV